MTEADSTEAEVVTERNRRDAGSWRERLRVAYGWLPVAILIGVAISQYTFVFTNGLIIWKGGGFGMFSAVEGPDYRLVQIYTHEGDEVEVPSSVAWPNRRAGIHPSDSNLIELARRVDIELEEDGFEERVAKVVVYGTKVEGEPLRPVRYLVNQVEAPFE